MLFQGFSWVCFRPSDIRWFSVSMLSTTTLTVSPLPSISEGWFILRVQLMSLMWTSPSIPSSISTKAPKLVRLRTLPSISVPTG